MSRLLLDTHAVLWWLVDDPWLSKTAREAIADPANEPLVSAASAWEIAIKRELGKLDAPDDLVETIAVEGFAWLDVTAEHAWVVGDLPLHHRDPFDRMLLAQARVVGLPVVSAEDFSPYGVELVW